MESATDMYLMSAHAYRSVAAELKLEIFPVGDAFHAADFDPKWGFVYDAKWNAKTAVHPQLPNQEHSLHTGWYWKEKDGVKTASIDGHHANTNGEYLGACVWYEVLFGSAAIGINYRPANMDEAYAHYLQTTAHQAVEASAKRIASGR
jgi:hypothetical protein